MENSDDNDFTPFWKDLMAHIDETWKKKKGVGFYFRGKYFREIKELCRIYTTFGVMALWDLYLSDTSDDFVRAAGHSFEMFLNKLPKLLDMSWKGGMRGYEKKFIGEFPKVIEDLARELSTKKAGSVTSEGLSTKEDSDPAEPEDKGLT